ncbi:MAG: HAD hydrolase family protein [Nanoarchaeota archaeon]
MKSIYEHELPFPNLLVFDVDGVIVHRGTKIKEDGKTLTIDLKFPPREYITLAKNLLPYTNVAISSGRSMLTLKTMFADLVGEEYNGNVFIMQAENGGRISWGADEISAGHNPEKLRSLSKLRNELRKIIDSRILGFEPKETILTIHCAERVSKIEEIVNQDVHYMIWNGEAYDIGDPNITKGTGLLRIKEEFRKRQNKIVTAMAIGDRQNDIALLEKADYSVSADPNVLKNCDFYVPLDSELPGVTLAEKLLENYQRRV